MRIEVTQHAVARYRERVTERRGLLEIYALLRDTVADGPVLGQREDGTYEVTRRADSGWCAVVRVEREDWLVVVTVLWRSTAKGRRVRRKALERAQQRQTQDVAVAA